VASPLPLESLKLGKKSVVLSVRSFFLVQRSHIQDAMRAERSVSNCTFTTGHFLPEGASETPQG